MSYLRQALAGLRVLLVLTVLLGIAYPLVTTAVAQLPGLDSRADGSPVTRDGKTVGSSLIGQKFGKSYFQGRPSAGDYDPTASGAGNLGPESVEDAPDAPSLLTQICTRSRDVGRLDGVDGSRPYCTATGVGAVLRVFPDRVVSVNQPCPVTPFVRTYRGERVTCAAKDTDYRAGRLVLVRGAAPAHPAVPADAVTASGSGLDPHISEAYARIQVDRVARSRGASPADVRRLVAQHTGGRALGFLGEPAVNVVELNLALDRAYPTR